MNNSSMIKKVFLLSFILSLSILAFGQTQDDATLNSEDAQGRKNGKWKVYDESDNLRYEGQFKNGVAIGTFTYYYPDGKVKAVSEMYDNGRRSYTKVYHKNGRLMGVGRYFDKAKDSTWNYFSDYDGVLLSSEYYVNGLLDSIAINYFPKGGVAEEIPYRQGVKEGVWKQYFSDGTLKLKATYENDLLQGLMIVYYPNGLPEVSGMYKNGLKNGMWMHFDEQGKVYKKETFERGHIRSTEFPGEK